MNRPLCTPARAGTFALVAALAGCGGGGGDAPAPAPAPAAVTISGVAADGPLQGATACYDLDDNGACDAGEPTSGATDADGRFSIDVAASAAGQHRVVVVVPATAIDKDTGQAVGIAYTLQSPATGTAGAHSVFVSPLSTLVQAQADAGGGTVADASSFVKAQASLAVSPLADYTASPSTENRQAATVARLVSLTAQKQAEAVAGVVGQVDVSGATITQADLDEAVTMAVIGMLPSLAAAAGEPSVTDAATPADRQAALIAAAQTLVSEHSELTSANAAAFIGVPKLPADTATSPAPEAGATLRAFTYTDAHQWFYRAMEASAADNTPDSGGHTHFYDVRMQSAASTLGTPVVTSWSFGGSKQRETDLHWNGSAWVACAFAHRSTSTPRDAQGRSQYDYCDRFEEGTSVRSATDIAGRTLRSVIETIRAFPGADSGVAFASFGPANLDLLGTATFPAGSTLYYQASQAQKSAPAYDIGAAAVVNAYTAAVAAGGDARTTAGLACAGNLTGLFTPVTTLEDLVARNPGHACVFNKGSNADGSSLEPNEWWGNSSASLGIVNAAVTPPAGTGQYYSANASLRVAFTGGNATTYYRCLLRRADNSQRNCTAIAQGTYAIQTLGDARAMTFTGLPAFAQRAGFTRVFIERGGMVYFGYRNPTGATTNTLRLNMTAANALFAQLGVPAIKPIPPASAADAAKQQLFANAKGAWGEALAASALVFRFGDGGAFLMGQVDPPHANEANGLELGLLDVDPATGVYASLLEHDSNWEAGTSHPQPTDRITAITADQLGTQAQTLGRLPDDPNGIVGLWALDSATTLKTIHIMFFANGRAMLIDPLGDATCGMAGVEYGSYTFDAATGALRVFGKVHDTNGCGGFFDSNAEADIAITFAADKKTLQEEGRTWYRIAPR
jgi:trimeric autotransporter adhesin